MFHIPRWWLLAIGAVNLLAGLLPSSNPYINYFGWFVNIPIGGVCLSMAFTVKDPKGREQND